MKNTVSVLMGLSLLAFHAYSAESRPSFHGAWQLNQELSEDPREKMMQAMGGGGGMGGGRGGMGGSGGMGGGRGGMGGSGGGSPGGGMAGGRGGGDPEAMRQRFAEAQKRAQELQITQGEEQISILYADGTLHIVPLDGESGAFKSRWKGKKLVITRSEGSRKIKETFKLDHDEGRLHVVTSMPGDGQRPGFSFTRVYDPEELDSEEIAED